MIGWNALRLAVGIFNLTNPTSDFVWSAALFRHQVQQWTTVINKCRKTEARCPLGKLLFSRRDRVINIGRWPLIGCIDQDGQWGQGKEGPAGSHRSNCLGSLTNSIAYQGAIMETNGCCRCKGCTPW